MSQVFKRLLPLLNRIVVRKIEPQSKTTSGILIGKTESVVHGVVLEVGPGGLDVKGKLVPLAVKVGDTVLLPEYGGQKVKLGEQELFIFRDTEIVAKLE
jgi:chaperonin GroES